MSLTEQIDALKVALPNLNDSDAKFAISLMASFNKYKSLTPKQEPWIGKLLEKATTPAFQVVASSPAPAASIEVGNFGGVLALFAAAKQYLKFPKINLLVNGQKVRLTLNGAKSKTPGAVSITDGGKFPYRKFFGTVTPEGVFKPTCNGEFLEALTDILVKLASSPARVAKEHGKLTGNCCFCNKPVGLGKEQRSVYAGFGPDCAEHFGLKGEWLAAVDKVEVALAAAPVLVPYDVLVTANKSAQSIVAELQVETLEPEQMTTDQLAAELAGMDPEEMASLKAELKEDLPVAVCFFCEEPSTETKELKGYRVCQKCCNQLQGGQ